MWYLHSMVEPRSIWRMTVPLVWGTLLFSCDKESPGASAEAPISGVKGQTAALVGGDTAAANAPQALAKPAGPRVSEENFDLALLAEGPFQVGKASRASVVLDAKSPFKINDKYPYKFKHKPSAGLSYPALVVGSEQIELQPKRATLPIEFTPQKPGRHSLAGQFVFSVCTEEKCLIERRDLAIAIDIQ